MNRQGMEDVQGGKTMPQDATILDVFHYKPGPTQNAQFVQTNAEPNVDCRFWGIMKYQCTFISSGKCATRVGAIDMEREL